ncbi:MAG: hypothetical protein V4450_10415 [Bacteroidota bacterium]
MKRIASILLLGILLFNWGGYRLLTNYFESTADTQLRAELDLNHYNEADLVSFKVAASLPYGSSSEKFERVDGNVEINGITYTYVKRRFYQDSLELLCIPNTAKAGIKNARDEFAKLANDFVTNNTSSKKAPSHHNHAAKFSVQDFTNDHDFFSWQFRDSDLSGTWNPMVFASMKSAYLGRLDRPPQA